MLRRMATATAFMHDYEALVEQLRSESGLPERVLEVGEGRWEACRRRILELLEV
jgi:hypothetical protein